MVTEILGYVGNVYSACSEWMMNLLALTGGLEIWMTAIGITMLFKFILSPIFGDAGSDTVKKSNKR